MATITWSALTDSNWNDPYNWTPNQIPGGSDDVIFNNTSQKNCTVDTDITVNSIIINSNYNGSINATGNSFTVYGNFTDTGGTGSRNYGNYICMLGLSSILTLNPAGPINYSGCEMQFYNSDIKFKSKTATFGRIFIPDNCNVLMDWPTSSSATPSFKSPTTPLVIGENSYLDQYRVSVIFIITNNSGNLCQMGYNASLKSGAANTTFKMELGNYTLPNFTHVQSPSAYSNYGAIFQPLNALSSSSLTLTGEINSTKDLTFYNINTDSNFSFNTNNYNITCASFYQGCTTGSYSGSFNSSTISCSKYSSLQTATGTRLYGGTVSIDMYRSYWTLRSGNGGWSVGASQSYNVGTYDLNCIGTTYATTNDVHCFYNVQCNSTFYCTGDFYVNNYFGGRLEMSVNSKGKTGNIYVTADLYTPSGLVASQYTTVYMIGGNWSNFTVGGVGSSPFSLVIQNGNTNIYINTNLICQYFEITSNSQAHIFNSGFFYLKGNYAPIFVMGSGSYFINDCAGLYICPYISGSAYSLGDNCYWGGSSFTKIIPGYTSPLVNIITYIPSVTYNGTGYWLFDHNQYSNNMTFNLNGWFNIGRNLLIISLEKNTDRFFTMNQQITCGELRIGSITPGVGFNAQYYFGSSLCDITYFNTITYEKGYVFLENSVWFCGGNWSNGGSTFHLDPGTSSITITAPGTISPNGKNFYDLASDPNNGSVTLDNDTTCHTLQVLSGNYTQSGRTVACSGDILFDNDGWLNMGNHIFSTGVYHTIRVGSSVSNILNNQTILTITNQLITMEMDQSVTFSYLELYDGPVLGAIAELTGSGSMTLAKSTTPLVMGGNSSLSINAPMFINMQGSGSAITFPFGGSGALNGVSSLTIYGSVNHASVTLPTLTLGGTLDLNLARRVPLSSETTLTLTGNLNMNGNLTVLNSTTGLFQFYSSGNSITAKTLNYGCNNDSGSLTIKFQNSSISITDLNPILYNSGSTSVYFYKSNWTLGRDWTFPSDHTNYHAWDKITFIGDHSRDGTVTSNGQIFNWLIIDSTSRSLVMSDDMVCREYYPFRGSLNSNGNNLNVRIDSIFIAQSV